MGKVNGIPASPLDFFLLPVWVHKKLSVRLQSLIFAFLFIGLYDMVFFQDMLKAGIFKGNFIELVFKLLVFILFSFILGAIDVICTMVPIAEFSVMIGKRSGKHVSSRMPVVLMKSYALSHLFFIIPSAILVYSGIEWENVSVASSSNIRLLFSILFILLNFMPYIQLGILYRTFSVKTRIQVFGKLILLLTTYFWMQLSGEAIFFVESIFYLLMKRMG